MSIVNQKNKQNKKRKMTLEMLTIKIFAVYVIWEIRLSFRYDNFKLNRQPV